MFVPGKPEIEYMIDMFTDYQKRGFLSGLYPYAFHADVPRRDREMLINGSRDPVESRAKELNIIATKWALNETPGVLKRGHRANPVNWPREE